MATIPEITGRLEAATEKAENASQIIYDVANGDATTEVPTASGPTPTLKKWFQDLGSSLEPMLAGIPARLDKAVLVYQTKIEAETAAATLPDGQVVDAFDVQERYEVRGGELVFSKKLLIEKRGADQISFLQGRSGEHRQDTLTRGIAVELNEPISGSGFAGASNTYMFNRFRIASDSVDAQSDGTPGTKVDGFIIEHGFGGSGSKGGRHALEAILSQSSPTDSDNVDRNYVGIAGVAKSSSGDGGSAGAYQGGYFAFNAYAHLRNSPYVSHLNGCESNPIISDEISSVRYRSGYSAVSGGVKQADESDCAYAIGALGVSGAMWKYGILAGRQNGRRPISDAFIRISNSSDGGGKLISYGGDIPASLIDSDNDFRFKFRVDTLEMFYNNANVKLGSKASTNTPYLEFYTDATGNRAGRLIANGTADVQDNGVITSTFRQTVLKELRPDTDGTRNLGVPSGKWDNVHAKNGSIVTSDAREKSEPLNISDAILDAWGEVNFFAWQWLKSIEVKGEKARIFHGPFAQHIRDAFIRHGLMEEGSTDCRYALLCYDEWEYSPAVFDDEGNEVAPAIEAGNGWGIRADQCLFLEAAYQRREVKREREAREKLELLVQEMLLRIEQLGSR